MSLARREFLAGLFCAPAIVRASSLMRISTRSGTRLLTAAELAREQADWDFYLLQVRMHRLAAYSRDFQQDWSKLADDLGKPFHA